MLSSEAWYCPMTWCGQHGVGSAAYASAAQRTLAYYHPKGCKVLLSTHMLGWLLSP